MFFYPKRTIFFTLLRPSTKETENDHGRKIQRQIPLLIPPPPQRKKERKKDGTMLQHFTGNFVLDSKIRELCFFAKKCTNLQIPFVFC